MHRKEATRLVVHTYNASEMPIRALESSIKGPEVHTHSVPFHPIVPEAYSLYAALAPGRCGYYSGDRGRIMGCEEAAGLDASCVRREITRARARDASCV